MKSYSAEELKNHTGEILRQVGDGEKILITKNGKPYAVLSPVEDKQSRDVEIRPFEEAWADIERALRMTRPRFKTSEETMRWTRSRG